MYIVTQCGYIVEPENKQLFTTTTVARTKMRLHLKNLVHRIYVRRSSLARNRIPSAETK